MESWSTTQVMIDYKNSTLTHDVSLLPGSTLPIELVCNGI